MPAANNLLMGFSDFAKELQEVAKNCDEKQRSKALEEGAEIIVEKAQELAPVRTGLLKREGIVNEKPSNDKVDVGWSESGFYGRFLELGTSRMAARPHLRPAYERNKNKIYDTMLRILKLL